MYLPPDDVTAVKINLNRMISFNNDVLSRGTDRFLNAYALLNQPPAQDLGVQIGANLLGGGFWAIGSLFGPLGNIPANFLSGLVAGYTTNTPDNLNTKFSNLLTRFEKTLDQANADFANYYQDPVSNWNKQIGGSFSTPFGTFNASSTVGDLGKITFPQQTDTNYMPLLLAVVKGVEQGLWAILLKSFVITHYIESNPPLWKLPCNPNDEDNNFLPHNKSYYNTWEYHEDKDCYGNLVKYYDREEYNLGTGASTWSDGALNDGACEYLFNNYASAVANPDGLFDRKFVFNSLNIPTANQYVNNGGGGRRGTRNWLGWLGCIRKLPTHSKEVLSAKPVTRHLVTQSSKPLH